MDQAPAPRNLVVLCDGTNNNLTGGRKDTHVVLLAELLAAHPAPGQVVYYDPGVGNAASLPGASTWDKIKRQGERVAGLAQGRGVFENIAEAYLFLMRQWRAGDRIFLFGFSRGAFTARSLGGLVNQFGLLPAHLESMLPTLLHIYFSDPRGGQRKAAAEQVSRLFAAGAARAVPLHFVGVWDTVAAVGMPPFSLRISAKPDLKGKRFVHVRQALALDEHRAQFKPRVYAEENGPFDTGLSAPDGGGPLKGSIDQRWFRGAHGDAGGGYLPEESALGQAPLQWLVSEAVRQGLMLQAHGEPLDTEARVAEALRTLREAGGVPPVGREPVAHDQTHANALWALTGLAQRETDCVRMDNGTCYAVTPVEHPVVAQQPLPASVWQRSRLKGPGLWIAALVAAFTVLMLGQTLTGFASTGSIGGDLAKAVAEIPRYLKANAELQSWQWLRPAGEVAQRAAEQAAAQVGPVGGTGTLIGPWFAAWKAQVVQATGSPVRALLGDFLLIAAYAFVLAHAATWAFARHCGLQRAGGKADGRLRVLGWALPVAVGADVAENLLSLGIVSLLHAGQDVLPVLLGAVLAVVSTAKWIGLAGVAVLFATALARRWPWQRGTEGMRAAGRPST